MKAIALLFFELALVYTASISPTSQKTEPQLLQDIMENVRKILNDSKFQSLLDSFVHKVLDTHQCIRNGAEDFCRAEKILSGVNLKKFGISENEWHIARLLKQYNKFHVTNCTGSHNGNEERLTVLMMDLSLCAQYKYAYLHPRSQRSADNDAEKSTIRANQH
ncbi:hypothetical protein DPEC_G00021840 [Dallia pectoralis]|uniref:Uncharacterized protein n=1 Tax=Dallia pectoralis TaxID=75939 RepID=A0ACC2HHS4_DALPE|nr:hypothetical protein DPEC_G00021840 [Dallia pectoralis]